MATVTVFSSDRMLEIENATVVDGTISGDNLILTRRDGTNIIAGNVRGAQGLPGVQGIQGIQGTAGVAGAAGSKIYSGSGAPTVGLGVDGDYYFDIGGSTTYLYGPKASGAWPAGIAIGSAASGGGDETYLRLDSFPVEIGVVLTNMTDAPPTASTTVPIETIRAPFAFQLEEVRLSASVGGGSGAAAAATVDIHGNSDVTILGNKATIDGGEKTSELAAALPTIVTSAIADDDELDIFLDAVHASTRGLKLYLIGKRTLVNANTTPFAPTGLTATPGAGQASLAWTAPSNTGGSAITDYIVQYKATASGTWLTFSDGVGVGTSAIVTGLTNGTGYDFRIAAVNANGTGAYTAVASTTPRTTPGAPTGLSGTPASGQVALSWTTPPSTGGSAITDYFVQYKTNASSTWLSFDEGVGTTTGATVTGLTNGTLYNFRVCGVNAAGAGAFTTAINVTPVAATAPAQVGTVTPTAGASQVALAWVAPANGGSAITDYLVEYKTNAAGTWSTFSDGVSAATGATVTGLTNGTLYNFRVSAINAVGTGTASTVVNATPSGTGLANGLHSLAPTANTGHVRQYSDWGSGSAGYAAARAGTANWGPANTSLWIGQEYSIDTENGDYVTIYQGLMEFDTQTAGGSCTEAELSLQIASDFSNQDFSIEVYALDYGTSIEANLTDWLDPTELGSATLLASINTASFTGAGYYTLLSNGNALRDAVNELGKTRLAIISSRTRLGNMPTSGVPMEALNATVASCRLDVTIA